MANPTALTLDLLRRSGYVVAVVEKWIPRINRRKDLWSFGDILAIDRREPGILIVQTTSLAHLADRLNKAKGRPELLAWLRANGLFAVHGWFKRAGHWQVKMVEVHAEDLAAVVVTAPARRRRQSKQPELFD